jgi:hypothetical protein
VSPEESGAFVFIGEKTVEEKQPAHFLPVSKAMARETEGRK